MSIWTQRRFRFPGRPRHGLGVWYAAHALTARAFVPSRRDRSQLVGGRPFYVVLGGPTDEVTLGPNQSIELRYSVQSDFVATSIMVSATTSSQSLPGCRVQLLDLSIQPGRGKKLSTTGVNNVNFGGSASHPFILRRPYRFFAGRTVICKLQNLRNVTNKFQVAIQGVSIE